MWKILASALRAQIDEAGSIVVQGDHHTLTLVRVGNDCVSLMSTSGGVVSGPMLAFPLISGWEFSHDIGSVALITTYRDAFQTRAQIFRDGTYQITGPFYRQPGE